MTQNKTIRKLHRCWYCWGELGSRNRVFLANQSFHPNCLSAYSFLHEGKIPYKQFLLSESSSKTLQFLHYIAKENFIKIKMSSLCFSLNKSIEVLKTQLREMKREEIITYSELPQNEGKSFSIYLLIHPKQVNII